MSSRLFVCPRLPSFSDPVTFQRDYFERREEQNNEHPANLTVDVCCDTDYIGNGWVQWNSSWANCYASPADCYIYSHTCSALSYAHINISPHFHPYCYTYPYPVSDAVTTWSRDFQLGAFVDDISGHNELMLANGMTWTARQVRHSGESRANEASIELAHNNGLRILLAVTGDGQRAYESDYQATFVSFLAFLAQQGADAIEVWNEPNLDREMAVVDPAQYTALLCASYTAIKEANPETLVISGAPAPTGFFGGCTSTGCDDLPWMQGLAETGTAECLDFIGAHHTAGATSPNEETGHPAGIDHYTYYFQPTVERYDEAFGGARPLAFTMFGYLSPEGYDEVPQWFAWAEDTTVAEQAEWTAEAVQMSVESDKVGLMIIWNLDSTAWGGEHNNVLAGWALIRQDGSCPTCEALHELLLQQ